MGTKVAIALLLVMGLGACATTNTGSLCGIGPFVPDTGASERWTRSEKEQLVTLNRSGREICHWSPP